MLNHTQTLIKTDRRVYTYYKYSVCVRVCLLAYSKLVCVKGVPREVRHIYRILDGGQGCVWQPARVRALRRGIKSLTHIQQTPASFYKESEVRGEK